MEVTEVQGNSDHKAFIKLPFFIYKDDPNWVPHLRQDVEKVFDPKKNKLFRHGELVRFLLRKNGKVIGRIAAFVNEKYSKGMEQPTGGVGFFECIDDQQAADALFSASEQWLSERGMESMDGPINFGEKNMFWGLLIKNFDDLNSYGMNYNPPYYQKLLESYGFREYYNQFCYKRDLYVPPQEIFVRKYNQYKEDPDYEISNIVGKKLEDVAEDFRTVYNNAWGGHHGFKMMSSLQAQKTMQALKPVIDREIICFVYHKKKPIAFYVNIPELNEIFCYVNGNLNWIGKLKFLWHKWRKTPKTMVGIVFGVDRDYHGKGIEGVIVKWTADNIVTLDRYNETIMTWIGDFNPKMIKITDNLGAYLYRTLRTYRVHFDKSKPVERMPMAK